MPLHLTPMPRYLRRVVAVHSLLRITTRTASDAADVSPRSVVMPAAVGISWNLNIAEATLSSSAAKRVG